MEEDESNSEAQEHLTCLRCGRGLKNAESRKIGYGPVCRQKVAKNKGLDDYDK